MAPSTWPSSAGFPMSAYARSSRACFGRLTFSGRHQDSISHVVNGEVDASAVDSHVLGVERLRNPDLAGEIRVITSFGPSTIPLAVSTDRVPEPVHGRIGDALCELGRDPVSREVLASGLIRRFVPIGDRAYDDVRQKMAVVDQARAPSSAARTPWIAATNACRVRT